MDELRRFGIACCCVVALWTTLVLVVVFLEPSDHYYFERKVAKDYNIRFELVKDATEFSTQKEIRFLPFPHKVWYGHDSDTGEEIILGKSYFGEISLEKENLQKYYGI